MLETDQKPGSVRIFDAPYIPGLEQLGDGLPAYEAVLYRTKNFEEADSIWSKKAEIAAQNPYERKITASDLVRSPLFIDAMYLGEEPDKAFERLIYRMTKLRSFHPETYEHSKEVAKIAGVRAYNQRLSIRDINKVVRGALLHDMEKVQIPISLLHSSNKKIWTPEEVIKRRKHSQLGFETSIEDGEDFEVASIIQAHHSFKSFEPYPSHLKIDLNNPRTLMQLDVANSDTDSALFSKRVYKPAWPVNEVRRVSKEDYYKAYIAVLKASGHPEDVAEKEASRTIEVGMQTWHLINNIQYPKAQRFVF